MLASGLTFAISCLWNIVQKMCLMFDCVWHERLPLWSGVVWCTNIDELSVARRLH